MTPDSRRVGVLAAILAGSGAVHLVAPQVYEKIVPPRLGDAKTIVLLSGIAELGCAALLVTPRTRRLGAMLSAGLFVGVFPANLYAVSAMPTTFTKVGAIARLPLQIPMITSALKVARAG
jgi:uncharacterized membrane protein